MTNNGKPASKKGSANAYSMAGLIDFPASARKQCTHIVPKAYGVIEHRCGYMSLPADTLCGTHRRAANYQQLRKDKEVKVSDMLSIIVELCGQLSKDNKARISALAYLRRHGVARDVVEEVLQPEHSRGGVSGFFGGGSGGSGAMSSSGGAGGDGIVGESGGGGRGGSAG